MPGIRCSVKGCKRKINSLDELIATCRCGGTFCNKHRLPEMHECQHDFKINKEEFIKNNLCVANKISVE